MFPNESICKSKIGTKNDFLGLWGLSIKLTWNPELFTLMDKQGTTPCFVCQSNEPFVCPSEKQQHVEVVAHLLLVHLLHLTNLILHSYVHWGFWWLEAVILWGQFETGVTLPSGGEVHR